MLATLVRLIQSKKGESHRPYVNRLSVVLVILLVALLGSLLTSALRAATYASSAEVENGALSGNYDRIADSTASSGASIKFGKATAVVPPTGYVVNLTDFGAICDGSHNDQPALQLAANDVSSKGGGTVMIPGKTCRIVNTASSMFTSISGSVGFRGMAAASTLALDSDVQGAYRELFRISGGSNVSFDSLTMVRASNVYGIFIDLYDVNGLTITNVTMDGKKDTLGGADIHGIAVFGTVPNVVKNVSIRNSTVKNTDFGMFQDSSVTTTVSGWSVDNSTFSGNYDDDLEFNAPNSNMSGISVTNSSFSNNKASNTSAPSGFAVGLANVQHAVIKGNTISGYLFDPIHIEDRSSDIAVDSNTISDAFTSPATNYASHVFIINRSHGIKITSNTFDTSANTNPLDCIYIGRGGGSGDSYDVSISGNTFRLKATANAVGQYGASNVTIGSNTTINL